MNRCLFIIITISLLTGCATPSQHFNDVAMGFKFTTDTVNSQQFKHKIYRNQRKKSTEILHVYLDGDGSPWRKKRWVTEDPTARNPLILRLMNQDSVPSILLGRPCYYGLNTSKGCDNKYWTSHRYSTAVVDSMAEALNAWLKHYPFKQVVLIGYSGGGSIALLMANQIKKAMKVATIAANLDVKRWSEFHGYLPLDDSLNPVTDAVLNQSIKQLHFAGQDDETVPTFIIKEYADSQINAQYYLLKGNDHTCCWETVWLSILEKIR